MALKQAGLIYRAEAATTLAVTPLAGEGLRIRRVFCSNPSAAEQYATLITGTTRVGFFRTRGKGGRHLVGPNDSNRGMNLLDYMTRRLGFTGYPVDQGFTFNVNIDTGNSDIFVVADSYDVGDISPDQPNGRGSKDNTIVNYGTNAAAIAATGYNKVDARENPAEMIAFPFGIAGAALVPAGFKVQVLMVGGQAVGRAAGGGNDGNTRFLRIRKGSNPPSTLFDRNDVGWQFFGTLTAAPDYVSTRQNIPSAGGNTLDWFSDMDAVVHPVIEASENEEMRMEVDTLIALAGTLAIGDIDVWVVMRIMPK